MGFQRESEFSPLVEAGGETPVVVQGAKALAVGSKGRGNAPLVDGVQGSAEGSPARCAEGVVFGYQKHIWLSAYFP